jgi:nucleotide-binding universal stress UspA family protein
MAGTIVVGIDGSAESKAALRFALAEARLRGAEVLCLHAWTYPALAGAEGLATPLTAGIFDSLRDDAEAVLDEVIAEVAGDGGGVTIRRSTVEEPAGRALVDASKGADLLVVGSRGHGGLAGLLLGSVSQQCAHHATCPVVIVPPADRA